MTKRARAKMKMAAVCTLVGSIILLHNAARHGDGWLLAGVAVGLVVGGALVLRRRRRCQRSERTRL